MTKIEKKGFTLVEVLIATFLILVIFIGIFGLYQLGLQVVGQSKNKIIATSLINAELEKIRNLPYQSVGVQGSFPSGLLESQSTINRNNVTFVIERRVDYVVDPLDGISPPQDECPNDYKKVEIKVRALGRFSVQLSASTDIAPNNLAQECAEGGGILHVRVCDGTGQMISSPLIEIKNPLTNDTLKSATPLGGEHYFALAAASYKVVVSKSGYSSERTYGTEEVTFPLNPHPLVLEGELTRISLSIDRLSNFSVNAITRINGEMFPVSNVTFNLRGEKIIGYDSQQNPVYKYSQNHTTDFLGHIDIFNLEWDNYNFSITPPSSLNLVETEPGPQPISLPPNTTLTVTLNLSSENSLLVTVQDLQTSAPIFSAQVHLFNSEISYDLTQYTNENGKTYFIPLEAGTYNLEVAAPGYRSWSGQISVVGQTTIVVQLENEE